MPALLPPSRYDIITAYVVDLKSFTDRVLLLVPFLLAIALVPVGRALGLVVLILGCLVTGFTLAGIKGYQAPTTAGEHRRAPGEACAPPFLLGQAAAAPHGSGDATRAARPARACGAQTWRGTAWRTCGTSFTSWSVGWTTTSASAACPSLRSSEGGHALCFLRASLRHASGGEALIVSGAAACSASPRRLMVPEYNAKGKPMLDDVEEIVGEGTAGKPRAAEGEREDTGRVTVVIAPPDEATPDHVSISIVVRPSDSEAPPPAERGSAEEAGQAQHRQEEEGASVAAAADDAAKE